MPCVLSKPVMLGSLLLSTIFQIASAGVTPSVDTLPTLPWTKCAYDSSFLCGDLYFCAAPASEWSYWNQMIPGSAQTYGSKWPMPPEGDPNGSNGYLYGFTTSQDAACVPGVAPIIRVQPGMKYKLTLHNTADKVMDPAPGTPEYDAIIAQLDALEVANKWMDPDQMKLFPFHTTNLHIHGFHQSGNGDHDNVLKMLLPGKCLTYTYIVPTDIAGGTMWYHPHFHGKTVFQVFGGALGLFIIEDTKPTVPGGLDSKVYDFLTKPEVERTLVAYQGFDLRLGNGNPAGARIQLIKGQWHRLRSVFANPEGLVSWAEFKDLSWPVSSNCEIREIAWDGVYASQVPYVDAANPLRFAVHGAERVDFAIKCNAVGNFKLMLNSNESPVAIFQVQSASASGATPYNNGKLWKPYRPGHLADLRDGRYPSEVKKVSTPFDLEVSMNGLNGNFFNPQVPTTTFDFGKATIHQINFKNTGIHPTHMHQQHFQVVQPGGCGPAMKEGEFYDTISIFNPDDTFDEYDPSSDLYDATKAGKTCLVRFRMVDFAGKVIIHCHVLDHEDIGIMGWFQVPIQRGAFEMTGLFSNSAVPGDCCRARLDKSGQPVCRGVPQCGKNSGWNTCNKPCSVPMPSCAAGNVCSAGMCYPVSRDAICSSSVEGESSTSASAPVYPWIIMGISIAIATIAVVSAGLFARSRAMSYGTVLIEESKMAESVPAPRWSTPFQGTMSPAARQAATPPPMVV